MRRSRASVSRFARLTRARRVGATRSSFASFGRLVDVSRTSRMRWTSRCASPQGWQRSSPALTKDRNSLPFMPASAVRPGMVMFSEEGTSKWSSGSSASCSTAPSTTSTSSARTTSSPTGSSPTTRLRLQRRRHQQHPRLRARLPGRRVDRARAELPLDELDPRCRQRRDREQPRPQAEAALLRARGGGPGAGGRGRGRAHRGALRRGRDRTARRRRLVGRGDRGLLPHERPEPRARGRARAPADPVPGDRRPPVLRAGRDQGRDGVPVGPEQPVRRRLAAADREPSPARDRRHLPAAPRHPRRGDGADAVPGDGRSRGGRARHRGDQGGARLPYHNAVFASVGAGARGRRAARGRARAQRHAGGARGGADDRGAGTDREPRGARRRGPRVQGRARGADAVRPSSRRSRSSPTRTGSRARNRS